MRNFEREARRTGSKMPAGQSEQNMAEWFKGDLTEWRAWSSAGLRRDEYDGWRKEYLDSRMRQLREASRQAARTRKDEADRRAGRDVADDPVLRDGSRKRVQTSDDPSVSILRLFTHQSSSCGHVFWAKAFRQ